MAQTSEIDFQVPILGRLPIRLRELILASTLPMPPEVIASVQHHVRIVLGHGIEQGVDCSHRVGLLIGERARVLLLLFAAEATFFVAKNSLDGAAKPLDPAFSPERSLQLDLGKLGKQTTKAIFWGVYPPQKYMWS